MPVKTMSLYWKCQLIGWMLFGVWAIVLQLFILNFDQRTNVDFLKLLFIRLAASLLIAISISHLIRTITIRLQLLKGSLKQQMISVLSLALLFTFLYGFLLTAVIELADIFYVNEISDNVWGIFLFRLMGNFLIFLIWVLFYFGYHYVKQVKFREREKLQFERELLALEGTALRTQMNPHFIFNCLNSIKSMIQNNENEKSIEYLVLFSKLIRRLLTNADKRQVSLFDEIETCKLYTELEAMRLRDVLQFRFDISPEIDLKSVMVPAMIIQPFIENAIWHGILPKENGTVLISIKSLNDSIVCEVDDDGIGRESSLRKKANSNFLYTSLGIRFSEKRLQLEKMLNNSNASIKIIDKYYEREPRGTRVVLEFKFQ